MAKYTKSFQGNYNHFLKYIENEIIQGSMSATIEDRHQSVINNVQCTILVFERYSYIGGNRVSMNVTIFRLSRLYRVNCYYSWWKSGNFF